MKNDFKKVLMNISYIYKFRRICYYWNRNYYWFKKLEYEKIRKRLCLFFMVCLEICLVVRDVVVVILFVYIGCEILWF